MGTTSKVICVPVFMAYVMKKRPTIAISVESHVTSGHKNEFESSFGIKTKLRKNKLKVERNYFPHGRREFNKMRNAILELYLLT